MNSTTILFDIDTQNDFCLPTGALSVPGADAQSVIDAQERLIDWGHRGLRVHVASADDHLVSDEEISDQPDWKATFPPHCLRTSAGAQKVPWTIQDNPLVLGDGAVEEPRLLEMVRARREILLLKSRTDVFTNPHTASVLEILDPDRIVVFGVATDICVAAAIAGLRRHIATDICVSPAIGSLRQRTHAEIVLALDACAGLDAARSEALVASWAAAGAIISDSRTITQEGT